MRFLFNKLLGKSIALTLMTLLLISCGSDNKAVPGVQNNPTPTPKRDALEGEQRVSVANLASILREYKSSGREQVYVGETVLEKEAGNTIINNEKCRENVERKKTVLLESTDLVKVYVEVSEELNCSDEQGSATSENFSYRYINVYRNGVFYTDLNDADDINQIKNLVAFSGTKNGERMVSLSGSLTFGSETSDMAMLVSVDRSALSSTIKSVISYTVNGEKLTSTTTTQRLADVDVDQLNLDFVREINVE